MRSDIQINFPCKFGIAIQTNGAPQAHISDKIICFMRLLLIILSGIGSDIHLYISSGGEGVGGSFHEGLKIVLDIK